MATLRELKNRIIEDSFFRPRWHSVLINPYFINRNGLYSAISTFAAGIPKEARIIDVGCGLKPYRKLFASGAYTGIDIQGGGHTDAAKTVDAYYDGIHIPFPDASFDALICTQVLEHADDPEALVADCARVLAPGGQAFFSMPFTYPEHEKPYDFRRFTRFEHKRLLEKNGFSEIRIKQTTGIFGTLAQMLSIWIFEGITFRATVLKTLLSILVLGPLQIIGLALDALTGKSGMTMDYVISARR
ncbi:MAG: class I SAM-dependent methyltransferase [Candidatus Paceibacterota bacterium]|jgi:SAM-dependent methyltransferase